MCSSDLVKVIERPTGSLTFGAGYSSAAGLGGLIEYGEKNFLGRGQALSFAINTGKDDQLYELSFYEPMFLRNDLGLGINLSAKDTQQQNAAYDTDSLNFGVVSPTALAKRSINVQYSKEAMVKVKFEGDFSEWVSISPEEFLLNPKENKKVSFEVSVPEDAQKTVYTGSAKFCFIE